MGGLRIDRCHPRCFLFFSLSFFPFSFYFFRNILSFPSLFVTPLCLSASAAAAYAHADVVSNRIDPLEKHSAIRVRSGYAICNLPVLRMAAPYWQLQRTRHACLPLQPCRLPSFFFSKILAAAWPRGVALPYQVSVSLPCSSLRLPSPASRLVIFIFRLLRVRPFPRFTPDTLSTHPFDFLRYKLPLQAQIHTPYPTYGHPSARWKTFFLVFFFLSCSFLPTGLPAVRKGNSPMV